jgi:[acyl-carrier-protein] S-malonyltransferase
MNLKTAFVFPGQGSQYSGMGQELCSNFEEARLVFQQADEALGLALSRLCFEGPEADLKLTENTQPAILTASIAAYRVLEARGILPDFVAGHSLGEYSALVAAGALTLEEAVTVVRQRGKYMQEAVPVGVGAMAAILGLEAAELEAVCREASQGQVVSPANFNSAQQIVIAGHTEAVERAMKLARERGAKRAIPLPVSAPFHCALMVPAQERLRPELDSLHIRPLRCGLINNVDARQVFSADEIRDGLLRQVPSPVRWQQSMEKMLQFDVRVFVEVGPGHLLAGLLKKMPSVEHVFNIEDSSGVFALENALRNLSG